jgi:hypothetical protein
MTSVTGGLVCAAADLRVMELSACVKDRHHDFRRADASLLHDSDRDAAASSGIRPSSSAVIRCRTAQSSRLRLLDGIGRQIGGSTGVDGGQKAAYAGIA